MAGSLNADDRYRWTIETGPHRESLVEGAGDSQGVFGNCFAMWVQNKGDISDWVEAPAFGAVVVAFGDLSTPVVAVWLGIEPAAIRAVAEPAFEPPWEFTGPDGGRLTVDRQVVRDEGRGSD